MKGIIKMKHGLYKDGDDNIPYGITDRNGDVVLSLCKVCGGAECALTTNCPGRKLTNKELDLICNGELDF
jgi:hypothetical protein